MALGRPSEYSPEYAKRVDAYLEMCKDYKDPETGEFRVKLPKLGKRVASAAVLAVDVS